MREALSRSSDVFAVKIAVVTAALVTLLGLAILGFLAITDADVDPELVDRIDRIVQSAFTGLLALLAATRTGTQPVQVMNAGPGEEVPVDPAP